MDAYADFLNSASSLPHVPLRSAEAYRKAIPVLRKHTNTVIGSRDDFRELTGGNPESTVEDNHGNHAMFMSTVFITGEYSLLAKTLPWVYRAYTARGFARDYFPEVVRAFMDGVSRYLPAEGATEILAIYSWMLDNHPVILDLAEGSTELIPSTDPRWIERKASFLRALLSGDHGGCIEIARSSVHSNEDLEDFYLQIIQPAMYEIGVLWERNEISVAQEHLASAIVTRTLGALDAAERFQGIRDRRVVVSASPGEFHEIGAWMVSDYFDSRGWQVRYLGANTPLEDLIALLVDFRPSILALSVTMSFNLVAAKEIIETVRAEELCSSIRVLVGGRVFNENEELWKSIGADGFASDLSEIGGVLREWDERY